MNIYLWALEQALNQKGEKIVKLSTRAGLESKVTGKIKKRPGGKRVLGGR